RRRRRLRIPVHGWIDGHRRRRSPARRRQARRIAGGGLDRRSRLGGCPHAGGCIVADADAAHDHRRRYGQGSGAPLYRPVDRSDDRRGFRVVRDGRRHHASRAGCRGGLCRRPRDRGDDPREAAGGVSAGRIPARPRHGRPPRTARRAACHIGPNSRAVAQPASGRRGPIADRRRLVSTQTSDRVLERLSRLHPKLIDLSLGRIERLLAALGNPQEKLPPVVHLAGTNGKGSTIATLRACLEAGGYRVHAYISPHLVRFHERICLAGELIEEEPLITLLEECERANRGTPITYFEITTAAALLAI